MAIRIQACDGSHGVLSVHGKDRTVRVVTGRGSSPHTGKLLLSTFDQILISFEPIEAKTSTTIDISNLL